MPRGPAARRPRPAMAGWVGEWGRGRGSDHETSDPCERKPLQSIDQEAGATQKPLKVPPHLLPREWRLPAEAT